MATFERIDPNGNLNSPNSLFYITDRDGEQIELLREEARQLMGWLRSFFEPLGSIHDEKLLRQIIDELFQIAEPGKVKQALWARYQGMKEAKEQ